MGTNDNKVVGGLDQVSGYATAARPAYRGELAGHRGELAIGCRLPIG